MQFMERTHRGFLAVANMPKDEGTRTAKRASKMVSASPEVLMCETDNLLNFCHEEPTEAVDGRSVRGG